MRKNGLKSPGIWDAICFLFLEDAHYMICEKGSGKTGVSRVIERADSLFAGV